MVNLKRVFVLFLIFSLLVLYFPRVGLAEESSYYAQADIKKHIPEVSSTPEEEMETGINWPWVVLGLLLLGGAVAAFAGGSGGGGGSSGGGSTSPSSGSVSVGG
jgi:hypothetical protein